MVSRRLRTQNDTYNVTNATSLHCKAEGQPAPHKGSITPGRMFLRRMTPSGTAPPGAALEKGGTNAAVAALKKPGPARARRGDPSAEENASCCAITKATTAAISAGRRTSVEGAAAEHENYLAHQRGSRMTGT